MNPTSVDETTPVIVNNDTSIATRDSRSSYHKKLTVNIILVCLLLQTTAFYLYGII
jgi:hypothetical protein